MRKRLTGAAILAAAVLAPAAHAAASNTWS